MAGGKRPLIGGKTPGGREETGTFSISSRIGWLRADRDATYNGTSCNQKGTDMANGTHTFCLAPGNRSGGNPKAVGETVGKVTFV